MPSPTTEFKKFCVVVEQANKNGAFRNTFLGVILVGLLSLIGISLDGIITRNAQESSLATIQAQSAEQFAMTENRLASEAARAEQRFQTIEARLSLESTRISLESECNKRAIAWNQMYDIYDLSQPEQVAELRYFAEETAAICAGYTRQDQVWIGNLVSTGRTEVILCPEGLIGFSNWYCLESEDAASPLPFFALDVQLPQDAAFPTPESPILQTIFAPED